MAKSIRKCKVCGKEYEYCKTWLSVDKFRWQDVACSPECGAIYFTKIEASRSINTGSKTDEAKTSQEVDNSEVTESASVETAVRYTEAVKDTDSGNEEISVEPVKTTRKRKKSVKAELSE